MSIKYYTLSISLLLILAASVFIPSLVRSFPTFLVIVLLGSSLFFSKLNKLKSNETHAIFASMALFFFIGLIYIIASSIANGWTDDYFHSTKFIIRQSYFVFLFPIFIIVGMAVSSSLGDKLKLLLKKHAAYLFLIVLTLDFVLAFLFGEPTFRENNGYTYLLDKTLLWFFVCYLFFFAAIYTPKKNKIFLTATIFFFLERNLGYGQMFNAATGILLYFYMALFYFAAKYFHEEKYRILLFEYWRICLIAILAFVFIAPFFHNAFEFDLNTYWRLKSWHDNLVAVFNNYGFGVGFGVSYFPDTLDVYERAYSLFSSERSFGNTATDFLFIRGQHSSFINIFFRLGVLGLLVFLFLYVLIFKCAKLYHKDKAVLLSSALVVCGISNIAFHVGLESPPFLISVALSTGFLLEALQNSIHAHSTS